VRENVCRVILRIGQQLRNSIETQLSGPAAASVSSNRETQ